MPSLKLFNSIEATSNQEPPLVLLDKDEAGQSCSSGMHMHFFLNENVNVCVCHFQKTIDLSVARRNMVYICSLVILGVNLMTERKLRVTRKLLPIR